ncbi:MAG: protein kinase [Lentisphaeraceae bacterium]|nr:protein kinase [Lentisphaeraceae bacterium]
MPDSEGKIKISCPNCSTKQYVAADKAFSKISCESCEIRFVVPKVFGSIMLHNLISNDEFSSTHNGTHLTGGYNCRVRIFNEKVTGNAKVLQALKEQVYKVKEANSEGLVKILNHGSVGDEFYIEFSSDDKGSLKSRIQSQKVSQKAALEFSISIGEGLRDAHAKNIVLANIKTSNIRCLKNRRVKLIDSGITWTVASLLHKEDSSIEKFNNISYIAPETVKSDIVNKASDIYNFACVVYELITKVTPFDDYSSREAKINGHLEIEPVSVLKRKPAIPADVDKIVMQMLSKDPAQRPTDLDKVVKCLQSNLKHVEEVKVEEIKREFDNPSPDQTLKPRPPTELDLGLLTGETSTSDTHISKNLSNLETIEEVKKDADLKSDLDKILDGEKIQDMNPELKLQNTEVNMEDLNDLDSVGIGDKGSKAMLYILGVFLVIVLVGIAYVALTSSSGSEDRRQLDVPAEPAN